MSGVKRVSWALCIALVWVACGDRRLRAEARAFLTAYESLDHRESPAVREQKLSALRGLVLTETEVAKTRDRCVAGHEALLESERSQEQAARALDEAVGDSAGGEPLSAQATSQIRVKIERAEEALRKAKDGLRACENEVRSLSLRFGKT